MATSKPHGRRERRFKIPEKYKNKGCFYLVIIVFIALGILGWFAYNYFFGQDLQQEEIERRVADELETLLPGQASGEIDTSNWTIFTSTTGTDLSFRYSPTWEISRETQARNEFTSFKSPADENGFYFCLKLNEYFPESTVPSDMTADILMVEDFTAEGIGKPLRHIVYESPDLGDLHFSVIDDTSVTEGQDISFSEHIVNPFGWKLMIQARYNCEDDEPPQLELDDFVGSQQVQEALRALRTLRY